MNNLRYIILALLLLSLLFVKGHTMTPAGTVIQNQASLEYDGGIVYSNIVTITIAQVGGVSLSPTTATVATKPGKKTSIPVQIINAGNAADSFYLQADAAIIWDDNQDGMRHPKETMPIAYIAGVPMEEGRWVFLEAVCPTEAHFTVTSIFDDSKSAGGFYSVKAGAKGRKR